MEEDTTARRMKFWQLRSITRDAPSVISSVASGDPDWARFGEWHNARYSPDDEVMSATEVYAKYGAALLESTMEYGDQGKAGAYLKMSEGILTPMEWREE